MFRNNLFGYFDKICKNYSKNLHFRIQSGNNYKFLFEGIEFIIGKYTDEEFAMITLSSSDDSYKCITIRVNKKDKIAEILSIGYFPPFILMFYK